MAAGYLILLLGWLGVLIHQVGWFANPLMIVALWMIGRERGVPPRSAALVGGCMALCVADALSWHEFPLDSGDPAIHPRIGYFVWLLATGTLSITTLMLGVVETLRSLNRRGEAPSAGT